MARVFLLVLDSFGIGSTPDAAQFGDDGANTLGHIVAACHRGECDTATRSGALSLPFMRDIGLGSAAQLATGVIPAGLESSSLSGRYGACREISAGKDTPSGHWELMGVPVRFAWGYFPPAFPSFPEKLTQNFIRRANIPGILGNCHASGTEILARLGSEHIQTGKPICYTSADSVFQIAVHEEHFGLEQLYAICEIARELVNEYSIGRVIARPFVGENGNFVRTANRRDYSVPPPAPTLLDKLVEAGREVISIGKIADIFAHRGITQKMKAAGTKALFSCVLEQAKSAPKGSLIFANFVDFDSSFGHRRDVAGYAQELELFDSLLPRLQAQLRMDDVVLLVADHGCDPTWKGTDHTREHIPILAFGPQVQPGSFGLRESFADVGQTIASLLGILPLEEGQKMAM